MKKSKSRFLALVLAGVLSMGCLAACTDDADVPGTSEGENGSTEVVEEAPKLEYAEGTVLRMATGYNSEETGIAFSAKIAESGITLADGVTYQAGDLKPTWVEVEKVLGVTFENKYTGKSGQKEFEHWREQLDQVDMVSGTAALLTEHGVAGDIVNLADYLDSMPNFKAYLEANPIVRLSITGDTSNGAIYFSPYFDGVNDIERMPLMRTDWVEKLLNGEGEFAADKSNDVKAGIYTPYMPTSGKVEVDVVKADGSAVEKVTKDYDAYGNIVEKMNAEEALTGVEAVNMLRTYIDKTYNGYYGTNRADLFIGQNAAWDADELVALLRCVVANPQTLNGSDNVEGLFSREDNNNQRRVDVLRFAGTLFGVRGLESRQDYLYVGADGELHDARQEEATYDAIDRMNAMVKEGLLSDSFVNNSEAKTEQMLEKDAGFMHYDYNQTQTVYNKTKLNLDKDGKPVDLGEKYMAVMVPVARWYDGSNENGVYMRFTESWRSVKTDGWGISVKGVGDDTNKLNAALSLIDFAYSPEGQILMSYGPDAFIKTNADGSYVTFDFNGTQMPVIADATYDELWDKAKGNYTNYARQYLGSTLSFVKSQAFEFQCTHEVGKEGAGRISTAIALGTIKHPELAVCENPWYTSVPTLLAHSTEETAIIDEYAELKNQFSTASTKNGGYNILIDFINKGYSGEGTSSKDAMLNTVSTTWGGETYLTIKNDAWDNILEYYESL